MEPGIDVTGACSANVSAVLRHRLKVPNAKQITRSLNIDSETLRDPGTILSATVAQHMSWAARRQATRVEDLSYSLFGIFQVNMTMQYDKGEEAFVRLQKEIIYATDDRSCSFDFGKYSSGFQY